MAQRIQAHLVFSQMKGFETILAGGRPRLFGPRSDAAARRFIFSVGEFTFGFDYGLRVFFCVAYSIVWVVAGRLG